MADVMILFGSGGHSAEMLMLIQNCNLATRLDNGEINRVICVVSQDDKLIGARIDEEFDECEERDRIETVTLRRGRRVGQSYISAIWTTIIGILHSINIVLIHKPQLCITNGPSISVQISLAIRFLQLITLGLCYKCDLLYVESFCRTRTLSLSGKIIYHLRLATDFYVQWPALRALYPRAQYKGILV